MNVDEAIRDFADVEHGLPEASMRWALDNRDLAAPRFVELLARYADGEERSETSERALFLVIHLLGEMGETRAFAALCRVLRDAGSAERILGDAIGETLSRILVSTYDGDEGALETVIEAPAADDFVRAAALDAMAFLTRAGRITDERMRAYLLHLRAEMQPQSGSFVWSAWALVAANLGYRDYAGQVEQLCRLGFIDRFDMGFDNFEEQLRRTLDDPRGLGGLEHDRIGPFTDAIGTLSTWYGFSEQARQDRERRQTREQAADPGGLSRLSADAPYVNPTRHVGRNDPCPCGSGKKFKKCCLQ